MKENREYKDRVRTHVAKGETDAVTKAVTECIREGIFADYLQERGSEVMNMLIAEYDYETDMAVQAMEAEERGKELGRYSNEIALIRKKLLKKKTLEQIADEIEENAQKGFLTLFFRKKDFTNGSYYFKNVNVRRYAER